MVRFQIQIRKYDFHVIILNVLSNKKIKNKNKNKNKNKK